MPPAEFEVQISAFERPKITRLKTRTSPTQLYMSLFY